MKKLVALALAVALFVCVYGPAFADTLTLPAMTAVIEEETYSYNPALDEVKIPWGAERIESRAFAHSGLKTIHIPSSVTFIADDAFEGTTLTIRAAADSYAREYADAHGIAWEDAGGDANQAIEALEDLRTEGYTLSQTQAQEMRLPALETINDEGIDDAALAEAVQEYNTHVVETNAKIDEYNRQMEGLSDAIAEVKSLAGEVSFFQQGGQVRVTIGDATLAMDAALTEGGKSAQITGMDIVDSDIVLHTSGGVNYYLYAIDQEIRLSREKPVEDGLAQGNAFVDGNIGETIDMILGILGHIMDGAKYFASDSYLLDKSLWNGLLQQLTKDQQYLNWMRLEGFSADQIALERIMREVGLQQDNLNWMHKQLYKSKAALEKLNRVSTAMTSLSSLITANKIGERFAKISEIYGHKHPTQDDTTPTAIGLSDELRDKIRQLMILYVTEAIVVVAGLAGELVALEAGPEATKAVDVLLNALTSFVDSLWMDKLYDRIMDIEDLLHTYVWGYITDEESGEAVEDATVFTNEANCRTDKLGYYRLYLPCKDSVTVRVSKQGYKDDGFVATLVAGDDLRRDFKLKPHSGKVYGYVYDDETRDRLGGVTVSCDEQVMFTEDDGYYEFNLPVDVEAVITFSKKGHKDNEIRVTPVEDHPQQRDILLEREDDIPIDEEHFPDDAFREFVRSSYDEDDNLMLSLSERSDDFMEITVSGAQNVSGIEYFFDLSSVRFQNASIGDVDLSVCPSLSSVRCSSSTLSALNVRGCTNLTELNCARTSLSRLDLSGCVNLQNLNCSYTSLPSLDVTSCINLKELECVCNHMSSVNCSGLKNLTYVHLAGYDVDTGSFIGTLGSANLSGCSNLTHIDCYGVQLGSLITSGCVSMVSVNVDECGLSGALDLSASPNLGWVYGQKSGANPIYVNRSSPFFETIRSWGRDDDPTYQYQGA